jgi:hypothetical protein
MVGRTIELSKRHNEQETQGKGEASRADANAGKCRARDKASRGERGFVVKF